MEDYRKKLLNNPIFQRHILEIIKTIDSTIYTKYKDQGIKKEDGLFFLKGGNAVTMLLNEKMPYPFESDFDFTLIINPEKYTDEYFIHVLKLVIFACVSGIHNVLEFWDSINNKIYKDVGLDKVAVDTLEKRYGVNPHGFNDNTEEEKREYYFYKEETQYPLFIKSKVFTPTDYLLGKHFNITNSEYIPVKQKEHDIFKQRDLILNRKSPFDIDIIPDIVYYKDGVPTPIGITLIKIKTHTEPQIELIDIAIPHRGVYKLYDLEWELAKDNLIEKNSIYIQNPLYAIYNQKMASLLNTRKEKVEVRQKRAKEIYDTIIKPDEEKYEKESKSIRNIFEKYSKLVGGYKPTAKNLKYLRKWKRGESIGFTMRSSLKAKGLIPRSNGTYRVSDKYKKRVTRKK